MTSNVKKKSVYRNKRWHLLLVRSDGRTVPVRYVRAVMWAVVSAAVALLAAAVVTGFLYSGLSDRNAELERRLSAGEQQLAAVSGMKDRLLAELAVTQSKLKLSTGDGAESTPGEKAEPAEPADAPRQPAAAAAAAVPAKTETTTTRQPAAEPSSNSLPAEPAPVSVENLSICHDIDKGEVQVEFKIINVGEKNQPVAGHTFTVLRDEAETADRWVVYPQTRLIDEEPVPTRGMRFRIYNFRTMKFAVRHDDPGRYTEASVFVFGQEAGELMFRRDFEINAVPPCP